MHQRQISTTQVNRFLHFLCQEERAPGTVEKYKRDLNEFLLWLSGQPVTSSTSICWKEHLLTSGLAPATVNSKLSALNGLFRFLGYNDCRVKFLKLQRRLFRASAKELSRPEYERLRSTAQEQGKERLSLLLETLCSTGIRVSEVRYITVEAARSGRTDISLKGKVRTLLLPNKLCRKLLRFAKKQKTASGEIFITKSGKSLSRRQIWREMKALCQKAGVAPSKVFPHNLRHLFATVFYRASQDIVKLADLLGHSSINTTRIYLQSTGTEHIRQLEQLGLVS